MQLAASLRKNPFAKLLLFYVAGIAFTFHCSSGPLLPLITEFALIITLFVLSRHPGFNTGWLTGFVAGCLVLMAGILNCNIHLKQGAILQQTEGFSGMITLQINEPAVITGKSVKTIARITDLNVDGSWKKYRQRIVVYFEKDSLSVLLVPGDRIICKARLTGIRPPLNPGEFNYKQYLEARNIFIQTYVPSSLWHSVDIIKDRSLKTRAYLVQQALMKEYQKIGLNKTLYSLLSALTLGYKNDLEAHTKQVFSRAGVMHVMALSGFNVAVIAYMAGFLLFYTGRIRHGTVIKTIIIIVVIWIFAFVTGLSPSVTRAAVMISLVMIGIVIHRHINTNNILYASAFILLTLSPALINDISFQLSFAAVFGIITFYPPLSKSISFKYTFCRKIWQLFSVACAAQLSTLPLTLYYFHQFPVYFWLTNLYVVPLVSVIICVTCFFLMISFIDPLMMITGKILAILLEVLYKSVAWTELLPYSVIENIRIDRVQVFLLCLFLVALGYYLYRRRTVYLLISLSFVAAVQIVNLYRLSNWNRQQIVMIGNYREHSLVNFINGRNSLVLSGNYLNTDDPAMKYGFMNFWIQHGVAGHMQNNTFDTPFGQKMAWSGENIFFTFADRDFMILTDENILKWQTDKPLNMDVLVVTDRFKACSDALLNLLSPRTIVIDSSVSYYKADKWLNLCNQWNVECWIVSRQGAWMIDYSNNSRYRPDRYLAGQ